MNTAFVNGELTANVRRTLRGKFPAMENLTTQTRGLLLRVEERLRDLGLSARAGSLRTRGKSADAIRNIKRAVDEGRPYNPRTDTIESLAAALETTDAWLLRAEGPKEAGQDAPERALGPLGYRPAPEFFGGANLPVYAAAEGGGGTVILPSDPVGYARRPHTLEAVKDAYAILINGESMAPAYRPGDTAWVDPSMPLRRDTDVIVYAVEEVHGEAKATIKELVSWTDTEWSLRQINPPKQFKLPRANWQTAHRVVGKFARR